MAAQPFLAEMDNLSEPSKQKSNSFSFWQQSSGRKQIFLAIAAIGIGVAGAYGAIGFLVFVDTIQLLVYGSPSETVYQTAITLKWWHRLVAPGLGGLMIGIFIHYFMTERRPHGVADVMEATINNNGNLRLRDGLAATTASAASIGVGASVGREGPVVHLLASMASFFSRIFKVDKSTKITLIGCGVASAVAASFNAPVAGAFFALEVIIGHYGLGAFLPVVMSSVVGTTIARVHIGDFPAFVFKNTELITYWEMPLFLILGCICALVAILYMTSCLQLAKIFKRIPGWRPLVVGFGGLLVGAIAVFFPEVIGVGYETTNLALSSGFGENLLLIGALLIAKTIASAISFGAGFAGGVFSPSLCIGALTGSLFGLLIVTFFPELEINPNAYSIVAMGAVAGAVLGAPISTFLMIFELTKNFDLTLAVMLSTVLASMIVRKAVGYSFFTWQLKQRGLHNDSPITITIKQSIKMYPGLIKVAPSFLDGTTTREIITNAIAGPTSDAYIVDKEGILKGLISNITLNKWIVQNAMDNKDLVEDDISDPTSILIEDATLENALDLFGSSGHSSIPIVDSLTSRKLVGVLYYKDVLSTFNRALIERDQQAKET